MVLQDVDNSCCQATNVKTLFIIGAAIYSLGTYLKVYKHGSVPSIKEHHNGNNRRKA